MQPVIYEDSNKEAQLCSKTRSTSWWIRNSQYLWFWGAKGTACWAQGLEASGSSWKAGLSRVWELKVSRGRWGTRARVPENGGWSFSTWETRLKEAEVLLHPSPKSKADLRMWTLIQAGRSTHIARAWPDCLCLWCWTSGIIPLLLRTHSSSLTQESWPCAEGPRT